MAVVIKHKKTVQKPDGTDESVVRPSDWNDGHAVQLTGPALLGKDDLGNGDAEEIAIGDGLKLENGQLKVDPNKQYVTKTQADQDYADADLTSQALSALDNSIPGKVRNAILTGIDFSVNAAITAADSVLVALGKLQKQITEHMADAKSHLNTAQKENTDITDLAGADVNGNLYDAKGKRYGYTIAKNRCVVTRTNVPNQLSANTAANFEFETQATEDLTEIGGEWANWYAPVSSGSNEATPGAAGTLHIAVWYNGEMLGEFKFGGNAVGNAADGANFVSDVLKLSKIIPAGKNFILRGQITNPNGIVFHNYIAGPNDKIETGVAGVLADKTLTGATIPAAVGASVAPLVIYQMTRRKAFISYGASQAAGYGDVPTAGLMAIGSFKSMARFGGYINASVGTNSIYRWLIPGNSTRRQYLAKYADYVLNDHVINDTINEGRTAEVLIADQRTFVDMFPNHDVYLATGMPNLSASTDCITTVANQTQAARTSWIMAYNNRLRRGGPLGVPKAKKILDIGRIVDAKRTAAGVPVFASGFWDCQVEKVVTDGAMTAGSNNLDSATAGFSFNSNGQLAAVPAGVGGAYIIGRMTYVSATRVTLSQVGLTQQEYSDVPLNASITVSNASVNLNCITLTDDRIHPNRYGYYLIDSSGTVAP